MKSFKGLFAVILIVLSTALYVAQIVIFHAERDTFFYLFQDLAFVPINVLLVTVIVDQVLRFRERLALLKKLNMVIGAFFSEVGTKLMRHFVLFDEDVNEIGSRLIVSGTWDDRAFDEAVQAVRQHAVRIDCRRSDLPALKEFLVARRGFLLGLLENQNLLEHASFTELLWAVFHLMEELDSRREVAALPRADGDHIAGDIKRAYLILIAEWLMYMKYLKKEYPYLFSLAIRTNPFDPHASVEVK
jgi:hypothetical protein